MILLRLRWTYYGALLCASTVGTGALIFAFNLHRDPALPTVITLLTVTLAVLTYSERKQSVGACGETMASALAPKTFLAVVAGAPDLRMQRTRLRGRSAAPLMLDVSCTVERP